MKYLISILLFSTTFIFSQSVVINEIMSSNSYVLADEDGDFSDWIEIYNPTGATVNLNGYSISDDPTNPQKWIFPNIDLAASEYLIVFASGKNRTAPQLHTNFSVKSAGETLVLSDASLQIINQVDATEIPNDISLGRNINNVSEWLFYNEATPGLANTTEGFIAFSENPVFSIAEGFYPSSVAVSLSTPSSLADIYYTTDGSEPTISSNEYLLPINISATTVLRAKSFTASLMPSKVITNTYFINESSTLPVFSVSTNPANLWDDQIGIYVVGANGLYDPSCGIAANYNQDWERPIHVTMFEANGTKNFGIDAGVKIHGGCYTSSFAQKSLRIKARGEYGSTTIPYALFKNRPFNEYFSFLLRNSGNDWEGLTMMRDGMMHTLVESLDLETQAYQPSIVFLNGEYWGIHNLRERIDKDYLAQYHNIDPNNIDLLEQEHDVVEGDAIHYDALYSYIKGNDLSIQGNYNYVETQMEIDNYVDYMISEMYFSNEDWLPMNTKFWRPRTPDGKWRWLLYDTDFGFGYDGIDGYDGYSFNVIEWVTDPEKYSAEMINGLLENQGFTNRFVNTFADYSNTIFKAEQVVAIIDSIQTLIEPEIERHMTKWFGSFEFWDGEVEKLRFFANTRIPVMQAQFISKFELAGVAALDLTVSSSGSGTIKLNRINVKDFPWSGEYFQGVPITLEALPEPGYEFVGWTGDVVSSERIITYDPAATNSITAVFQLSNQTYPVVINEINYKSGSVDPGDWIELYNNSDKDIDISGWKFKDSGSEFSIPVGTILGSEEYLVLCQDVVNFNLQFPTVLNFINIDLGFGFDKNGEALSLFSLNGTLIDFVDYDDSAPWPTEPDGGGPSLELKHPDLDNQIGENWSASVNDFGTPGEANSTFEKQSLVDIKLFLEGAFIGSGLMTNETALQPDFSLTQPYNIAPWNYNGTEQIAELPNNEIVDWVLVELRSGTDSSTRVKQRAGLLKQNGSVVDIDGTSNFAFYGIETGDYYIIIYHRNHLSVMSNGKIHID